MLRCPVGLREFGTSTPKRAAVSRLNTFDAALVKFARSDRVKAARERQSSVVVEPAQAPIPSVVLEATPGGIAELVDPSYFSVLNPTDQSEKQGQAGSAAAGIPVGPVHTSLKHVKRSRSTINRSSVMALPVVVRRSASKLQADN